MTRHPTFTDGTPYKIIKLTKGCYTIVSPKWYDYLMQWKWHINKGGYAIRFAKLGESDWKDNYHRVEISMSRVILGLSYGDIRRCDHVNRNKLDNRVDNLRIVNIQQNNSNNGLRKDNSSGYKGVNYNICHKRWTTRISRDNKRLFIGHYAQKIDAALAYDRAAQKYHGEYAYLNIYSNEDIKEYEQTNETYSDGTPFMREIRKPLIVFEGTDSSGKTTISKSVFKYFGEDVVWWSKEPYLDEHIELINRKPKEGELDGRNPYSTSLIYAADRAHHCMLLHKILKTHMCITDRYYYSNLVYQSVLDNVPLPWLYSIQPPNLIKPDLIFFCTCHFNTALARCMKKGETQWTSQQLYDLQEKYHDVLKCEKRIIIDTTDQGIDECVAKCITEIERLL